MPEGETRYMIFLLALSLGIDAFAVATSCGMSVPKFRERQAFGLAIYFGLFQAGMAAIGAFAGSHFSAQVDRVGHIIAFALLVLIGGHMIFETLRKNKKEETIQSLSQLRMLTLAVATSIDALAAGVSLGLTGGNLIFSCTVIGVVAFGMTLVGGFLGGHVGEKFSGKASIIGGLVLIALGVRSLF